MAKAKRKAKTSRAKARKTKKKVVAKPTDSGDPKVYE